MSPEHCVRGCHGKATASSALRSVQKAGLPADPNNRVTARQTICPFDRALHVAMRVPFAEAHAIARRAHWLLARMCPQDK